MSPILEYRRRHRLALRPCAARLGVGFKTLHRLEQGAGCSIDNAARITLNSNGELGFSDLVTDPVLRERLAEARL